jgi:hypothetical protein
MLRSLVAVALVSALAAAAGCGKPMTDFTSAQYKFKTKFPGAPKEQSKPMAGTTLKMFATESRNGAFMVGVADMPIPANEPAAMIEERLDGAQTGAIANVGGALKSSTKVTLAGKHPGRDFTATITKPVSGLIRARVFLVGTRMYQVMVVGSDSYVNSADANLFFDSFALTE